MNNDFPIFVFPYSQRLSSIQEPALLESVRTFLSQWKAHDSPMKAEAWIEEGQFLLVEVDPALALPSGCSKDKLYHFVKNLNKNSGLEESDLNLFFVKTDAEIMSMDKSGLKKMWEEDGQISGYQLFPNWIASRSEYEKWWGKPLGHFQTLLKLSPEKSNFQK